MCFRIGALILLLFAATKVSSQELVVLTEEDPPYSQTGKDGKPTGFGVDVVKEIQHRLGGKQVPITIQPWARVYWAAVHGRPNVIAFTMSRTKERENLFQWVGPLIENKWVIVAPKSAKLRLSSLDDAKKLRSIGNVRGYAATNYLTAQGFKNLDQVSERKKNPIKLDAHRISAFVSADCSYTNEISGVGLKSDDYEIVLTFSSSVPMYIAFSKSTDAKLVESWQSTLDAMKKDGSFSKMLNKWLPSKKIHRICNDLKW